MRIEIRDVNTRRNILLHGEQTGRVSGGYLESVTAQVVYDLPHFSGLLRNEPDLIAKTFAVAGSNREMLAVRRPSQMFYLIIWRRRDLIINWDQNKTKRWLRQVSGGFTAKRARISLIRFQGISVNEW